MNKRLSIIFILALYSLFLSSCSFLNSNEDDFSLSESTKEQSLENFTHSEFTIPYESPKDETTIDSDKESSTTDISMNSSDLSSIAPTESTQPTTTQYQTTLPQTQPQTSALPPSLVTTAPQPSTTPTIYTGGYYSQEYLVRDDILSIAKNNQTTYSSYVQRIFELTNQYRTQAGVPALTLDSTLNIIASYKSAEMKTLDYFSHDRLGLPFYSIFYAFGYTGSTMGENIARGYDSPDSVCVGWKNSPGHYSNMISEDYTSIGIGVCFDQYGVYYWTQEFGN